MFLVLYNSYRTSKNPSKSSFFTGVTRQQLPYVAVRVVAESVAHLLLFSAFKIMAASKVILILENPFLISFIALLTIGESITKHEVVVFFLATIGIILISQDEVGADKKSSRPKMAAHHPNEYDWEQDIYGIAIALVAATIGNFGIVAIREL